MGFSEGTQSNSGYTPNAIQMSKEQKQDFKIGLFLTTFGLFVFFAGSYITLVSKVFPAKSGILKSLSEDYYYSFTCSSTVVVTILFIFMNWLGIKFYKHN
jgi:hypothetical protein